MIRYPVLLFHSTDARDLLSLRDIGNIRPELFEKFIAKLTKEFDIVSLKEIIRHISGEARTKERLLALTFDDGPKSFATQAVPVMETYDLPSTCFLITDCIDDKTIYWRYLYNYCIHKGLSRELAGLICDEYKAAFKAGEIISFSRSFFNREKNRRIIEKLRESIIPEEEYRDTEKSLFLSFEDIRKLRENPLVSFGIHTRSHPVLKSLSDDEIRDEIAGSLDFYRSRIGHEAPMFSVPFGRLFKDYDERTITIARALSVEIVLSAYGGANGEGQPCYNIRRIPINEGNIADGIDTFIRTLSDSVVSDEYLEMEKRLAELLSFL